jgi:glycosyltransferase A (GT-A) superfamily protein (DUF2064 family)
MTDPTLVIIAKPPVLGLVKSRLAAGIGAEDALAVYRHLLAIVARTAAAWTGPVLLSAQHLDGWHGTGLEHLPRQLQPPVDLGGRIGAALRWGLTLAPTAVAIGTDCPGLTPAHVRDVAAGLDDAPLAFGPAMDGGYWAIGASAGAPLDLVCAADLPWSTPRLLAVTRQRLQGVGLTWHEGPTLADCDDRADLEAAIAEGLLKWPSTGLSAP